MAVWYLDTSALVRRHVQESGTAWVLGFTDWAAGHDLYAVRVAGSQSPDREVATDEARRSADNFRSDWKQQRQIIEVTASVADKAMNLAEKHGLRGYDAVHLAAAYVLQQIRKSIDLPALTFVSADVRQRDTAAAEGLTAEDPTEHN